MSPVQEKKRSPLSGLVLLVVAIAVILAKSDVLPLKSSATRAPARGELMLEKCEQYDRPFVCGKLGAPLDYTNEADPRNASLAVIVYPAGGGVTPQEEVLGSLLLNPGGPGVSGVWMVGEGQWYDEPLVEHLDRVLEGKYNLVGFDPRGAGSTYPRTHCFGTDNEKADRELAYYSALAADGFPGFKKNHREDFEIGTLLAQKRLVADLCANSDDAEMLRFIGTPFVARDMQLLHRALGDDKLNYWGFSYGTVIGSTYADMFPLDVGHVVLDGVIEMPDYYSGRWHTSLQDIDAELAQFFAECAASPHCALREVAGSKPLMEVVMNWLEALKTEPGYALGRAADQFVPPQVVTHSAIMLTFFEVLREPLKWPELADALHSAITKGDFTGLARPAGPGEENEEYYAIGCSDSLTPPREFGINEYKQHSAALLKDSPLFGDLFSPTGVMCTGIWPIRAAELHHGDFTANTAFPLLAIGNDLDPVTPGQCADDLANTFPNAVSVRRAGYGHCSFSQPSACIDRIAADYFLRGQLPSKNTRCEVDRPIWS